MIEDAFCFAHEINIDGYEIAGPYFGSQRHIDGFVAGLFRKYHQFNPDDTEFFTNRVYPVFRGVAQFYRGNLTYNEEYGAYMLPEWLSISEFGMKPNTLDAVMNAAFALRQAAEYLKRDPHLF